jgi:hypothetical protein
VVEIYLENGRQHRLGRWPDFNFEQVESEPFAARTPFLKSPLVFKEIFRDPKLASLPIIADRSEPAAWISKLAEYEIVRIKYPWRDFVSPHRYAQVIRIRAHRDNAEDFRKVLDALPAAYNEVFILPDAQRRRIIRDTLNHSIQSIEDDICKLEVGEGANKRGNSRFKTNPAQAKVEQLNSLRNLMKLQVDQFHVEDVDRCLYPIRPAEIRSD